MTIENVSLTATNVMVMMTVEITVMKRDVVCEAYFIRFYNCALCSVGSSVCVIITRVVAEENT